MANMDVVNLAGEKVGEFELADEVFAAERSTRLCSGSGQALSRALRQGTHATKNRKLVPVPARSCGSRRARAARASARIRSPLWRHGGTVHGPQPRSYDYAFPRKKLLGALRSAMAAKLADGKLTIVDSLRAEGSQDQALPRGARQARRGKTTLLVESSRKL
jgi:large subunit ribosomal protein L4